MDTFTTILGISLVVAGTVISVPQAWKTYRTRDIDGLSLATMVAWMSGHFCWLAYEIYIVNIPTTIATSLVIFLDGAILFMLAKEMHKRRLITFRTIPSLWGALALPVFAVIWLTTSPSAAIIVLTVAEVAFMIPQLRAVLIGDSASGVSIPAWVLRVIVYPLWALYGVLVGEPLLTAWSWGLTPIAVIILARAVYVQRRSGRLSTPAGHAAEEILLG